jgi:exosortase
MVHVPGTRPEPDARLSRSWAILVLLAFTPALFGMARVWTSVPYYAHGFLVPVFAAAAGWGLRDRLVAQAPPGGAAWAWAGVLVLYLLGLGIESVTLQGLAVVGGVAAGVLQLWGMPGLRTLAFPVAFLVFMVPLPAGLVEPFILWLQLQVSSVGVSVLHALGSGVSRAGNVLMLPSGEALFVADACSGITSLITLTPLAVALAWYAEKRWSARFWVLASVVPLAMGANLLRVVGTTLAVERWGTAPVMESAWHELSGVATFTLACVGLLAVSGAVRRGAHATAA